MKILVRKRGRPRLAERARPVRVLLPAPLYERVAQFSEREFVRTSDALRTLVERGLERRS